MSVVPKVCPRKVGAQLQGGSGWVPRVVHLAVELVWVWPWSWGRSGKALLGAPRLSGEGVGWGWDAWPLLSPVRAVGAHEQEEEKSYPA